MMGHSHYEDRTYLISINKKEKEEEEEEEEEEEKKEKENGKEMKGFFQ